jgi:uncharacterized protein (TIGR00375 family)
MDVENLDRYARLKGIRLLGTGDFTHPQWLFELKSKLTPTGEGLFQYGETLFILTVEVCNNFRHKGMGKRIHNIIFAPSFETVEQINTALQSYGDLRVDGRPNLSLSASDLVKLVLDISPDCFIVPAHVWTPWFSLFGANSGFDRITDCFGDQTENIYALETGLSSDPPMNWRLSCLDRFTLISNSDAHSPVKIGREANIFDVPFAYREIREAIKTKNGFLSTIEFFPQEGKYHYDGHRNCDVCLSPKESNKLNNRCPVCGAPLTVGVMHRIDELADRPEGFTPEKPVPCRHLVPLTEIISEALDVGEKTVTANTQYDRLVQRFGTEFNVLLEAPAEELEKLVPGRIYEGILKVRNGEVQISPGYDGVYGKVKMLGRKEQRQAQMNLF